MSTYWWTGLAMNALAWLFALAVGSLWLVWPMLALSAGVLATAVVMRERG